MHMASGRRLSVTPRLTAALLATVALAAGLVALSTDPPQAVVACAKVAAPGGADSAAGSAEAPYRSAQTLVDSLAPGETGCLRGGSYDDGGDTYVLDPAKGGSDGAPITVRSYPGERAKLVGIVKIDSDDVTLSTLDLEGTGEQNTIKVYAEDTVIEDSDITNASRGRSCLILGSIDEPGRTVRTIVRRNTFHECGDAGNREARDHAIYTASMADGKIVDNVIYNPAAYAITLNPDAQGNLIAHNVIDGASALDRGGVVLGSDENYASNENVIERNVIAHAETYSITTAWSGETGSRNLARANCVWDARIENIAPEEGFTAKDNTVADPGFVDRSARDYRLGAGSPCLAVVGYDTAARLSGRSPDTPLRKWIRWLVTAPRPSGAVAGPTGR